MKKRLQWVLGTLVMVLAISATSFYFHKSGKALDFLGNKQKAVPPKITAEIAPKAQASGEDSKLPYVLPILGQSQYFNSDQQASMQSWRDDARQWAIQQPQEIYLNGKPGQNKVALTFDDGPDGTITPQILDILKAQGIHASFCYVGTQMQYFPEVVKETAAQGNLIISHTFDHPHLDQIKPADIQQELTSNDQIITKLTGQKSLAVRPPHGEIDTDVVNQAVKQKKLIILWSIDTLDWTGNDVNTIVANVLNNVRPGDIILMHSLSNRTNTIQAVPLIINGLRAKGYSMVRVDDLIGRKLLD